MELHEADPPATHRREYEAWTKQQIGEDIFSEDFLLKRPLLEAIQTDGAAPPVLLIDEVDRSDSEFEAFLLEILSDFQITIPEIGTIRAKHIPYVVLTSNRTREIHEALETSVPLSVDRLSVGCRRSSQSLKPSYRILTICSHNNFAT